jgi:hypothetical protein
MMPQRNPASLSDSVRRAQRETGGQILGAEPPPRARGDNPRRP